MFKRFISSGMGIVGLSCLVALLLTGFSHADIGSTPIAQAASTSKIVVAQDGSGNYKTVQAAVNAVPANNKNQVVIYIKNGTYQEVVTVPSNKPYITFYGESEKGTVITYNNYHGKAKPGGGTFGTGDSASVFIQASDFSAYNITFQNTAGAVGQAVAINVTGDRAIFDNCQFLGWQDTLYAQTGRQYYENSYITGRIDYVFGDATAVFQNTEFYNVNSSGGTITAQKRMSGSETTGYVLVNDKIDGALTNSTYFGRPWGPYARVIVMDSSIGSDINAAGWENWSTADYHKTAYFAEYNNTGPGSNTSGRVSWSHQLTTQQAQQYSVNNFLNQDGWLTTAENYLNSVIAAGFPA